MADSAYINSIWELDLKSENGLKDLEYFLEQGGDCNELRPLDDYWSESFLQRAVTCRNVEAVALLLEFGADVSCVSSAALCISCPLSLAAGGDLESCEMLVEHGANVNQSDSGIFLPGTFNIPYPDNFPLYAAARGGYADVIDFLMNSGADPNVICGYTRVPITPPDTPIAMAATRNHYEAVSALITGGADVNFMHPSGFSALHQAIVNSHLEIFHCLVEAGADVHQRSSIYGTTPLWIAQYIGRRRPSEANREIQTYIRKQKGVSRLYWWAELLSWAKLFSLA